MVSVLIGLLLSLLSFILIGNAGPKYNIAADLSKPNLCQALSLQPQNYRKINYSNGFPLAAHGSTEYDVVCGGDPGRYLPSSKTYIFTTWQFYANVTIYSVIAFGSFVTVKKTRKK